MAFSDPSVPPDHPCPCRTGLPLWQTLASDVDRYRYLTERDQGSRGGLLVLGRMLLLYPGLYGVLAYRLAHAARGSRLPGPLRLVVQVLTIVLQRIQLPLSGVELSAQAHIGPGLFVNHAQGVVIGPVLAGENLTVSHNVTIGQGTGRGHGSRTSPTFGDRVWIGVGAVVTGALDIGDDALVGANAVVLDDVPARGVAVGVPARVVSDRASFANVLYRGMDRDPGRNDSLALQHDVREAGAEPGTVPRQRSHQPDPSRALRD